MQVLLLKDVEGLGEAGDIKNVAGGYAQNYLFPRKLAAPATEGALKQAKSLREAAERRRERRLNEARGLAAEVDGRELRFKARAGEGDRLYGSITNHDIVEALAKETGIQLDHRFVNLEHPIKELGEHEVGIKVAAGATATVRVHVERQTDEE
jgi:large subunit ribosomal protein L9